MTSKKHLVHSGKTMLVCLLLLMLMIQSVYAETVTVAPTSEPPSQESVPVDPVEEAGVQLRTGPVLMVTDYDVVEGEKIPGSSFMLKMNIANLSEKNSAHNVLATLTIENQSVALQEGVTNQMYFHEIRPGQTVSVQYPMEVYSYCTAENMFLTMTMTCYDDAAIHYDFQTMMTPNIDVARTLQISSLTVPRFVHRNSSMIIGATLTNAEPVTLDHVRMHVVTQHGEWVTEVGRLLSGERKTINGIYRFPEQQTEQVHIYFTYESLSGHKYVTKYQDFEVVVYDPAEQSDLAESGKMGVKEILGRLVRNTTVPGMETQLPIPVFVPIVVGCLAYIVVLFYALRNKRR